MLAHFDEMVDFWPKWNTNRIMIVHYLPWGNNEITVVKKVYPKEIFTEIKFCGILNEKWVVVKTKLSKHTWNLDLAAKF